jgi:hypothetical protein
MRFAPFIPTRGLARGPGVALLIVVLALALRFWDINARALWFDEASEYWVATSSLAELPASVREGSGDPPLYSFLLHVWSRVGTGEIWLRSLSVIFSVAGLVGVMVFAHGLGGWTAAGCAGTLAALSAADIRYAQEVGQYALAPAAVAWSLVALWRLAHGGGWRWIIAWAGCALAASYAYYAAVFTVMVPFACVVAESVLRRDRHRRRTTGTALVLYVIGVLPLVLYFLPAQLSRVVESGGVHASAAPGGALAGAWRWIAAVLAFQFTGWPDTRVPAAVPLIAALVLIVLAARTQRRALAWLVSSWAVYGASDAAGVFPHGFRWGMILFPLVTAVTGAGVAGLLRAPRARWMAFALFAALVAASAASLPHRTLRDRLDPAQRWSWPETEDMRVVASFWREHRVETQPTYVYYGAAPAFAYYTRAVAPREGLPPTWHLACWRERDTPGFCRMNNIYYGRWLRQLTHEQKVNSLFATLGQPPSELWLVFAHISSYDDRDLLAALVRMGYRVEAAVQARDAAAFLVARRS